MTFSANSANLRFGPGSRFELQPRERRLMVGGQPATLGSRAFDLLLALVGRAGQLMTKNELLDAVWPGLVVEEANLNVQVSTLRKLLGGEVIATVPGRGYRFAAPVQEPQAQAWTAAATPSPVPPPVAAPPLRLVGRDDDLAHIEAMLQRLRGVSLVGPSGVGKTSLARLVASRGGQRCVWVDLASLTDGAAVATAALRACGQVVGDGAALPQLVTALGTTPLLLVLDNAEHLVDAVATLVAGLLQSLPQLRVLVTSQVVLQGTWESVYRLGPLPLAAHDGAQTLLAERIAAAGHRVTLDAAAQPLLDAICRQLDGLPLALEMAATRVPLLGLKRVHDELAHRFALLTMGRRQAASRHRTLHAALDWSYGLLGAEEQRLFRALGLYAGGFTLDLVVAQMGADAGARWDVVDRLAVLVDRSLVVTSPDDPPRYQLLETMRAYALEQLAAQGEEDAARRRQGQVLLALMRFGEEEAVPQTRERCAEIENVAAALPWLQQHDFATAAEMCTYSATHDTFTPWRNQTSRWMEAMEPRLRGPEGEALPPAVRVGWWTAFARTLVLRRNRRAPEVARHAGVLARAAGDAVQLQNALIALVRSRSELDAEAAAACTEIEALAAAHPAWPARRRLATAGVLAHAALCRKDFASLLTRREQELALHLEMGSAEMADVVRTNLLYALSQVGRDEDSLALAYELLPRLERQRSQNLPWAYSQMLSTLLALGGRGAEIDALLPRALAQAWHSGQFMVLEPVLQMLADAGRWHDAARMLGLVHRLEAGGDIFLSTTNLVKSRVMPALQRAFDAATLQRLHDEGASLDEASVLALVRGGATAAAP